MSGPIPGSEILAYIHPFVLGWIDAYQIQQAVLGGGTAFAPTPHALNGVHHSGTLDDIQAPQFLKTDGSRALTGNLAVSPSVTIDGVDISVLAASVGGIVGANPTASVGLTAVSGSATTFMRSDAAPALSLSIVPTWTGKHIFPSGANSAQLGDFTNSNHTHLSAAQGGTLGAGAIASGLLALARGGTNADLSATGGAGQYLKQASAGGAISVGTIADVDLPATIVRTSRTLTAGAGLTGAGDLFADRTFNVGAGLGITVNADDVALTTPGTLSVSSANAATGSHTHAITSSSNPGAAAGILATDASGNLRLQNLTLDAALHANGGTIDTTAASVALFNATATTINAFGAATAVRFGAGTSLSMALNKAVDTQFDLDVNGNFRAGGYIVGKHAIQLPGALMIAHYDGAGPFTPPYTDFTGNPTGHLGQVATQTGGVIYQMGKFGKAIQGAEATTNVIRNPSAETNVTDATSSGVITITRDSTYAYIGAWSFKWHWTSGTADFYFNVAGTLANSTQYSVSFYARRSDGAAVTGLTVACDSSTANFTPTIVAVGNGWYYVYGTKTTGVATTQIVGVTGIATGVDWYFDNWQCEAKAYPTPTCDGSLGVGHSWQGTAHASKSDRVATTLTYPTANNIVASFGSVSLWVYINAYNPNGCTLWQAGNANADLDCYIGATGGLNFRVNGVTVLHGTTVTKSAWHHIVCVWDTTGNTMNVYLDYVAGPSGVPTTVVPPLNANMGIGYSVPLASSIYAVNGYIDDFVILNRVMGAAEVRAIYESNAPVFAETSVFSFRDPSARVWMDSNGVFAMTPARTPAFLLSTVSVNTAIVGGVSETLAGGSIMFGDNNASKANILFDPSTGKLNFRGGTTVQGYIDTNGKATFGSGTVTLDSTGISILAGNGTGNAVNWIDGGVGVGQVYFYYNASTIATTIQATGKTSTDTSNLILASRGASGGSQQATLLLKSDASVPSNYAALYSAAGTFAGVTIGASTAPNAMLDVRGSGIITGDVKLTTAGSGLYVKEGTNATMGTAVLVAGVKVVSTTKVTASSRIFLSVEGVGGTLGIAAVTARTAGTSFTITSSNALDTSTVAWLILEPA